MVETTSWARDLFAFPGVFAFPVLEPATKFEWPAEIRMVARATPQLWRMRRLATPCQSRETRKEPGYIMIRLYLLFIQSSSGTSPAHLKTPASVLYDSTFLPGPYRLIASSLRIHEPKDWVVKDGGNKIERWIALLITEVKPRPKWTSERLILPPEWW